jgi:hypothetical protein
MPAPDLKVAHAKEMLKRVGGRGCVIMLFDDEQFAVVEWGKDSAECARLKVLVNAVADKLASGELPAP